MSVSPPPPMPLSLCNELLAADGHDLGAQCRIAAELGYAGLEIAPGTLGPAPHAMDDAAVADVRRTVEAAGLAVTGLHWLLAPYPALSITDPARREATLEVLAGLVRLCAGLGGRVLVHGSPAQRAPRAGDTPAAAIEHATALFARLAPEAERAGVTYCLEPLSDVETPVINRVEEALRVVEAVGSPAFATMIDTSAAARTEAEPVAALLDRWLGDARLAHVQLNDSARGAPGTGDDPFEDIVAALHRARWPHPPAVEPFATRHDGAATAAIGIATIRAHERHPA